MDVILKVASQVGASSGQCYDFSFTLKRGCENDDVADVNGYRNASTL